MMAGGVEGENGDLEPQAVAVKVGDFQGKSLPESFLRYATGEPIDAIGGGEDPSFIFSVESTNDVIIDVLGDEEGIFQGLELAGDCDGLIVSDSCSRTKRFRSFCDSFFDDFKTGLCKVGSEFYEKIDDQKISS